jgi:class 3 adenylate cyclase
MGKREKERMLEPSLASHLAELISANFKTDDINELGRLIDKKFDAHKITGERRHVSIGARRAAGLLIDYLEDRGKVDELIKLVAEVDQGVFAGRKVSVTGIEAFFHELAKLGVIYDYNRRKLHLTKDDLATLSNFGSLRDGKSYRVSVASIDIVGNSKLVRRHGTKTMEKVYYSLWAFLNRRLSDYNGRIWSWAGDGGILAFALDGNEMRALKCALEIQTTLPLFNRSEENPIAEPIELRVGLDCGKVKFFSDTGKIISDTINYAAHLEKGASAPGKIAISRRLADEICCPQLLSIFESAGTFEDSPYLLTRKRLDQLFVADGLTTTETANTA